jgi:hypothetical protein
MSVPYIYKITDTRNGMMTIGKHNGKVKSYFTSSKIVNNIAKKYGREIFKREIIVQGDFSNELLNELEKHYIRLYATVSPNGYNLTIGGDGGINNTPKRIKCYQYDFDGNLIKIHESITEQDGNNVRWRSCKNIHRTYKGFLWRTSPLTPQEFQQFKTSRIKKPTRNTPLVVFDIKTNTITRFKSNRDFLGDDQFKIASNRNAIIRTCSERSKQWKGNIIFYEKDYSEEKLQQRLSLLKN